MKQPKTQKEKFAVLYAQESLFWKLCTDHKWPEGLREKYRKFGEMVDKTAADIDDKFDMQISGFEKNDDISHYDIDKAVKKEFGDKISTDSESGQFYAYCNAKHVADITSWLHSNYPTLGLKFYENDTPSNPYFDNWTHAEHFCKENEFEVVLPVCLDLDVLIKIKEVDSVLDELSKRKRELLNLL